MAIKRNTIQRAMVLETVNKLKCHATADEVYQEVVKLHSHISRGTVYRNLSLLSEAGEIQRISVPGSADRFDHRCHRHYHIRCLKCGRVFDVDMDYIGDLEEKIHDTHGFEFSGHNLMFDGVCPTCRK